MVSLQSWSFVEPLFITITLLPGVLWPRLVVPVVMSQIELSNHLLRIIIIIIC